MAICIVHCFEMVDVGHNHRYGSSAHLGALDQLFQLVVHVPTIVEAGELIDDRQFKTTIHAVSQCLDIAGSPCLRPDTSQQFLLVDGCKNDIACTQIKTFSSPRPIIRIANQQN